MNINNDLSYDIDLCGGILSFENASQKQGKGKGNHTHHRRNINYVGMSEEEKKKAITKNYYEKKGRLYYAKKCRIKNYDMTENDFKDCLTIEEMDLVVRKHLIQSGLCEKMVEIVLSKTRRQNKGIIKE